MLVSLGAQHVVVVSRSGMPKSGKELQKVEAWRAAGIEIEAFAADTADYDQLKVTVQFDFVLNSKILC